MATMFRDAIIKSLTASPKNIDQLAADTLVPVSVLRSTINSMTTKPAGSDPAFAIVDAAAPIRVTDDGIYHLTTPREVPTT